MSQAIQRVGDANSAGGVINDWDTVVYANDRKVAVRGLPVTPHPCYPRRGCGIHGSAKTQNSQAVVFVSGIPVVKTTDLDTCGHPRQGGSPDVFVG